MIINAFLTIFTSNNLNVTQFVIASGKNPSTKLYDMLMLILKMLAKNQQKLMKSSSENGEIIPLKYLDN